jgi:hypothetical protein
VTIFFIAASLVPLWKDPRYRSLRPLGLSVLAMWLISFKWYDWWGGRCFGYRPIIDTIPFLTLLLAPGFDWVFKRRWTQVVFGVCATWSVMVQVAGALAYTQFTWNMRPGVIVRSAESGSMVPTDVDDEFLPPPGSAVSRVAMDIDKAQFRGRLWSIRDSQLAMIVTRFPELREARQQDEKQWFALFDTVLSRPEAIPARK